MIQIRFSASSETASLSNLLQRYANVPMSVADACLVRLSESHDDCVVFTTDSDFNIYRRHGNQLIPLILWPNP